MKKAPDLFQKITVAVFLGLGTAIFVLLIYYGVMDLNGKQPGVNGGYDIEELKKVPAGLIKYEEQKPISVESENLHAVAVNASNEILVSAGERIFIYSPQGEEVGGFPLGQSALCLSSPGERLIYAGMADHVEVYTRAGTRENIWATLGEKAMITSIAADGSRVFVADAGNKLVMQYDAGGKLIGYFGGETATGEASGFIIPSPYFDLSIAPDNTLWLVNPGKHRLLHLSFAGNLLESWGTASTAIQGFSGCCNPTHIAITEQGNIVTSEKGLVRVKIYNQRGGLEAVAAAPDKFADDTVGLDLAVNRAGDIFILDPYKKQVRIFKRR